MKTPDSIGSVSIGLLEERLAQKRYRAAEAYAIRHGATAAEARRIAGRLYGSRAAGVLKPEPFDMKAYEREQAALQLFNSCRSR